MKLKSVALLFFLFSAALQAQQKPDDFSLITSGPILEVSPGGSADIKIAVRIPEDNHIYVRPATAMSFNIATSFRIPDSEGFAVDVQNAPEATKHDTDYILEGKGRSNVAGVYELRIFEQKGRKAGPQVYTVPIIIKTQMCNSKTNICFRPQEFKKSVRIKVIGEKQSVSVRATSNINWVSSYDQAMAEAKKSGKNVFVVITAPSWCGYCQMLERDVFSKDNVAAALNGGFIPLRILDTNSDQNKFQFSGYPTMKIASSSGQIVKDGGIGRSEQSFLAAIAPFAKTNEQENTQEVLGKDEYRANLSIRVYKSGANWVVESPVTGKVLYTEARRDEKYIILKSTQKNEFLAVPLNGDQGYFHDGEKWSPAFTIQQ
ncbi:MAG: thioredoxin family protein [Leptospiraceae bacterium]|nr:thioredoxin family protein [Leptospiraceae bacterium]